MRHREFLSTVHHTSAIPHGRKRAVDLVCGRETVPAVWLTPEGAEEKPAPTALLLHGFSSTKERMARTVGRALLARGVASLALDLPFHGARMAGPLPKNPLALVFAWRTAVAEALGAVEWLATQPETDAARIGVMGYSLGGFLALEAAAEHHRVQVVALAAAGDLPDSTPYVALVRKLVDPLSAARRLGGRPLLLINGRRDTTTRAAQAERLFAAASEPKTMVWYDGGHGPPQREIYRATEWTAARLQEIGGVEVRRAS